jgi:hypothetical protein
LEGYLASVNLGVQDARFLPLVARRDWIVILDRSGDVAGYAPFDGFF